MARGIGIEISDTRVRAVSIETAPRKIRILSFSEQPIGPADGKEGAAAGPADVPAGIPAKGEAPPSSAKVEAIRKAVAQVNGGRGAVVAGIDSGEAIVRELSLPFKNEDQIRKTVAFELENLVHNYSIEDLVVDTFKTGETEKCTTLMAVAVPKKLLAEKLKLFEAANYLPVHPNVKPRVPELTPEGGKFKVNVISPETLGKKLPEWKKISDQMFR